MDKIEGLLYLQVDFNQIKAGRWTGNWLVEVNLLEVIYNIRILFFLFLDFIYNKL